MSIDGDLRCNNRKCRRLLESTAHHKVIVTLCSHVFCQACGQDAFSKAMVCPACQTPLTRADEIMMNELSPSEEYKSLILAGLRPDTIMEIASRAFNFYVYQSAQERNYLESVCRQLDEKLLVQANQQQQLVAQAQSENTLLRERMAASQHQREQDKQRIHDLTESFNEKSRQLHKLQKLYDTLKRRIPLVSDDNTTNDVRFVGGGGFLPAFGSQPQPVRANLFHASGADPADTPPVQGGAVAPSHR